ncbi:oligosaccharide flippase family protein [Labilibaculum euxinus]|uniref:Oligosaccharide flippase family protein n=1 Tax=Labilibaculum euxinus TaxID=2686357 RepID=A0A7M4DAF5_9BACT|nr:oligosaccharide flippase family protein [Labilibaculum euxinus]MUP39634.1 oligosaccharide flippase family protein [Labilibaculum euxinus]MVB08839.1 oligosaccharide flippase family protein [Labilibaculum euxinus]
MAINQLKAGAVLSYVVLGLSNLVGLLYTPYMLRMMGQSEYGLYSLVASVIAYLTILDLGFGNAIVRYTAKFRAEGKIEEQYSMFGMFIVLYSAISVFAFLLGLGLYYNVDTMFGDTMTIEELDKARIMMLLMVFNLTVTFPLSIFGSIITAYEDFVYQKVIQIVRIVLNTVIMIALLELGYRAIAMVVLVTIFNIATLLLNYWYCMHKIKIKIYFRKFQWGFLKEVAIYSFFIFLNVIMDRIYWSTGQFVLGAFVGTAAVAVFAVAIQLESMYMNFSVAISGVFLPKVTAMTSMKQSDKVISDLFIRTGRIQYIVLSFILSGFILFGKQFIILWAGDDYIDVYYVSLLFFIPLTIPLIQNLGITILQARNQMKFRSLLYIVIAMCSLALQIPLAKHYGVIGCAVGISGALVIGQIIVMNIYYYKSQGINIPKFWNEIAKMSIFPLVIGVITHLLLTNVSLDTVTLALAIAVYSIVYIPAFWFLSMNQYERDLLGKPLMNKISKFKFHNQ